MKMWKMTSFILVSCMSFALLIGCDGSNVDDPKVREKILAKAIDKNNLQTRQSSGEELHYAPNQKQPYVGWAKSGEEFHGWRFENGLPQEFYVSALYQFENGKRHGLYISWYRNQQSAAKGAYKDGSKEGLWTEWHENGQKRSEGIYKRGLREGLWTVWDENNQKISEGTYKSGKKDGSWTEWEWSNWLGQEIENEGIKNEGTYKKDSKEGLWTVSDENGQKIGEYIYKELRTTRAVNSVAFSPDGKILASGSDDGTVRLWNVTTGTLKNTLEEYSGDVVSFSPDGKTLASGNDTGMVILWDVATGTLKNLLLEREHTSDVNSVSFSPDGKTLASGHDDGTVILWDIATITLKNTLGYMNWDVWNVDSVSFSPDGKTLASGHNDGTVRLWDVATGTLKNTFTGSRIWANNVWFDSRGGSTLLSGNWKNKVHLWDVATGTLKNTYTKHDYYTLSLLFMPPDTGLARWSFEDMVNLWDVATGWSKYKSISYVDSVSFSSDGITLARGNNDGMIQLWKLTPSVKTTQQ